MKIAVAQIAPVFLHRDETVAKVAAWIHRAADAGAKLVVFGETVVPAYPYWLARTDGSRFDSDVQKELHARYLQEGVSIGAGHLEPVVAAARERGIAVIVGVAERPADRGGHTIYCSRVFLNDGGRVLSVHRKLMPTYDERLAWGIGDGAGLVTHRVDDFTVGALCCWENWMPLARAALYAAGENLHVMLWPGARRNTHDTTPFIAKESRSYVASASGLLRAVDIPDDVPLRDQICDGDDVLCDGGSCIADPRGNWLAEPVVGEEALLTADLDMSFVLRERQNFDASGHYARPDVLRLTVDRRRQSTANFDADPQD